MPSAQPHEAMRRASDSVWVAIWRAFLQIATYVSPKSEIDCGTRRHPYSLNRHWISYP